MKKPKKRREARRAREFRKQRGQRPRSGKTGAQAVLWNSKLRTDSAVPVKPILTGEGESEEKRGNGLTARTPPSSARGSVTEGRRRDAPPAGGPPVKSDLRAEWKELTEGRRLQKEHSSVRGKGGDPEKRQRSAVNRRRRDRREARKDSYGFRSYRQEGREPSFLFVLGCSFWGRTT